MKRFTGAFALGVCRGPPPRVDFVRMSTNKAELSKAAEWENELSERESSKLYGLPTQEAELDQFARWLDEQPERLNLFPEYQREYVWKPDKASRLIVTVLCSRLVPAVVLHEKEKGTYDVVDGKQRLTSLLAFYLAGGRWDSLRHRLPKVPDLSKLTKLDENYEDLNGLSFAALAQERQLAFKAYSITYMKIPYSTPKEDVFEVYEDINSGGEDLTPQQVRRAVFYGEYVKLLDTLAKCPSLHAIRDPRVASKRRAYEPSNKEAEQEMVLRAFAFQRSWKDYTGPLKKFLNREVDPEKNPMTAEALGQQRATFESVTQLACDVFGEAAFRKWELKKGGGWGWSSGLKGVSLPLWDVLYSVLVELQVEHTPSAFKKKKDVIVQRFKQGFEEEGEGSLSMLFSGGGPTSKKLAERRTKLKTILQEALDGTALDRRRLFPRNQERILELFDAQEHACPLCQQSFNRERLGEQSYCQLDHIEPHSKGGRTVPENEQLVHAWCNAEKGARDSS